MKRTHLLAIPVLLTLAGWSWADANAGDKAAVERTQLTGDWFGWRPKLEERGLTVEAELSLEAGKNVRGGLDTAGCAFQHYFNLTLDVDLQKLAGLQGSSVFLSFHHHAGRIASDEAGDFQFVSYTFADGRDQITELYWKQKLLEEKLVIKAGKIDLGLDFGLSDHSWDFSNASISYPLSSLTMPTYPESAFGLDLFVYPTEQLQFGIGIFDGAFARGKQLGNLGPATLFGAPEDLYLIAEGGVKWELPAGRVGRVRIGGWWQTGSLEKFSGGTRNGVGGCYLVLDQWLWRENPADKDDEQGLAGYVVLDVAQDDVFVQPVKHHLAGGVVWHGCIPTRDEDVLGAGFTWAHFTDHSAAGFVDDDELAIELFYKVQITPYLSVKPDVQYIINPGGAGLSDALVFSLRVDLIF